MDVRSIEAKAPVVEHNGTVPVWWMIESREFKDITDGGFLELVNEFEVPGGGLVDPHSHPTHEFYYVTNGRGIMTIGDESREIAQGDLVHIPPDTVHSLRPVSDTASIHCFCFAVGMPDAGPVKKRIVDASRIRLDQIRPVSRPLTPGMAGFNPAHEPNLHAQGADPGHR